MEYFFYNKGKKTLSLRDGVTYQTNRLTLNVTLFEAREGYYYFEFERHKSLGYKSFCLPIQNTVLISIEDE